MGRKWDWRRVRHHGNKRDNFFLHTWTCTWVRVLRLIFQRQMKRVIFMLIAHFLLHLLFSEYAVKITCFSLSHLPKGKMSRDIIARARTRQLHSLTSFFCLLMKRNPWFAFAVSSILEYVAYPHLWSHPGCRQYYLNSHLDHPRSDFFIFPLALLRVSAGMSRQIDRAVVENSQ